MCCIIMIARLGKGIVGHTDDDDGVCFWLKCMVWHLWGGWLCDVQVLFVRPTFAIFLVLVRFVNISTSVCSSVVKITGNCHFLCPLFCGMCIQIDAQCFACSLYRTCGKNDRKKPGGCVRV